MVSAAHETFESLLNWLEFAPGCSNGRRSQRVTAQNVDLSNCDQEQIQFSNAVQPHAVLLAMDPESGAILQASANVKEIARAPHSRTGRCSG